MKTWNILVTVIAIALTVLIYGGAENDPVIDTFDTAFDGLGRLIGVIIVWVIAFGCYAAISKHYKPS